MKYSEAFLEVMVKLLYDARTVFVSPKVVHLALSYLFYALTQKVTFNRIQPCIENILFEVVIPLVYLH